MSSLTPTGTITSVFYHNDDGSYIEIARNIDNAKLLKLCGTAGRQECVGARSGFVCQHPNAMLLRADEANSQYAIKLVRWIKDYDFNKPVDSQTITRELIGGSEDFNEVVKLYSWTFNLRLSRDNRGQNLRDDICDYLNAAPLSANEFIMLHELCSFDKGRMLKIQSMFMWGR